MMTLPRALVVTVAAVWMCLFSGCATAPKTVNLPYQVPTPVAMDPDAPTAAIVEVRDTRSDPLLDMFVPQGGADFVRGALAAELVNAGVFSRVNPRPDLLPQEDYLLRITLTDASWAVPNHEGIVKTAFWTSFLTGGVGGVAYGSTETPVFGRAHLALLVIDRGDGAEVLNREAEVVHETRRAKLKCDTLTTRAEVVSAALQQALVELRDAAAAASIGGHATGGPMAVEVESVDAAR